MEDVLWRCCPLINTYQHVGACFLWHQCECGQWHGGAFIILSIPGRGVPRDSHRFLGSCRVKWGLYWVGSGTIWVSAAARFAHIITQTRELVRHLPRSLTGPLTIFKLDWSTLNLTLDRHEKVLSNPRSAPEVNNLEGDAPLSSPFFAFVKGAVFLISTEIFWHNVANVLLHSKDGSQLRGNQSQALGNNMGKAQQGELMDRTLSTWIKLNSATSYKFSQQPQTK